MYNYKNGSGIFCDFCLRGNKIDLRPPCLVSQHAGNNLKTRVTYFTADVRESRNPGFDCLHYCVRSGKQTVLLPDLWTSIFVRTRCRCRCCSAVDVVTKSACVFFSTPFLFLPPKIYDVHCTPTIKNGSNTKSIADGPVNLPCVDTLTLNDPSFNRKILLANDDTTSPYVF